jgi:hypothetical protein
MAILRNNAGFSLVEVAVAVGIFAFAAVGILSLFSVALKSRADSALETRSAIIAEEIVSIIRMSGGLKNAIFRDGPALEERNNQSVDLTRDAVVLGYPTDTTVPFGLWHPARGKDPRRVWEDGALEPWVEANRISTLAYVRAVPTPTPGLYQLICEVRSPAGLPLSLSKTVTFTTMFAL